MLVGSTTNKIRQSNNTIVYVFGKVEVILTLKDPSFMDVLLDQVKVDKTKRLLDS